jgi:hypothetical protein
MFPSPVLKQVAADIAPFLVNLLSHTLLTETFPDVYRVAFITPIIKGAPISNLLAALKLLDWLVARQVIDYRLPMDLPPAYRPHHSTETAVPKVLSDDLEAVDVTDVASLVLLDLSAAFDAVDHNILLRRLQLSYAFDGPDLRWFRSY